MVNTTYRKELLQRRIFLKRHGIIDTRKRQSIGDPDKQVRRRYTHKRTVRTKYILHRRFERVNSAQHRGVEAKTNAAEFINDKNTITLGS